MKSFPAAPRYWPMRLRSRTGEGTLDAQWDDWNALRDTLRTKRTEVKGETVKYLPPQLQDEAADLDESGTWEKVSYEGEEREFWRPTAVEANHGSPLRSADGRTITEIRSGCPMSRSDTLPTIMATGCWSMADGSGRPLLRSSKLRPVLTSDLAGIREGSPG